MDLKTHHDKIINTFNRIISNERDRASDAGTDRESLGSMIELCGLNKKATSFAKALHKMEPEKRDDVLRSFDALRIELEKNWGGQRTPDMLTAVEEPKGDDTLPGQSYEENFNPAGEDLSEQLAQFDPVEGAEVPASDEPYDLAAETDDFEAQLAQAAE